MKGFQRKKYLLASGLCLCLLTSCAQNMQTENIRKVDTAMGTIISQNLYVSGTARETGGKEQEGRETQDRGGKEQEGRETQDRGGKEQEGRETQDTGEWVQDAVMELIDRLESDTLSWRMETSEIWKINENAGSGQGTEVSPQLAAELEQILEVSRESRGALDVTVGDVVRLWDIDEYASGEKEGFTPPDEEAVRQALLASGYERITIEDGRIFLPEGMKLDLGAVGKGLACGRIAGLLAEYPEVTGAVISLGGSVLTYGKKPDQTPWKVGILDPADPENYAGTLTLTGQWFVSTSGDYERYVEVDGRRYHHIIDPGTGYPADSGVRSVTILGKDGLLTDALSTACFVLGTQDGLRLAEQYEAEALFIDSQGVITMTEGMEEYFREQ